jgi:uncharacterized protein (TIGR03435 family)
MRKLWFPACVLVIAAPIFAQKLAPKAEPPAAFDAASVRANKSEVMGAPFKITPGRLTVRNYPLRWIIINAYLEKFALPNRLLVAGGPAWLDTDRYDITATFAAGLDDRTVYGMLRALLAERFRLVLHGDEGEIPVYWLTQAKGGAKLRPLKEEMGPLLPDEGQIVGGGFCTARTLAEGLWPSVGRPVIDRTGISGMYDFRFIAKRMDAGGDSDLPVSILAAIEEQLGLKLVPAKDKIQRWVIDHVERPTEN